MNFITGTDHQVLSWFQAHHTPFWNFVMLDITALGGHVAITLLALFTFGMLSALRRYRTAIFVASAVISGALLVELIKILIGRARPTLDIPPLVQLPTTSSFPSGHSALSAVVYLTLALLVAGRLEGRRARAYLITCSLLLTFAIGLSRMYLGVHYLSDVLAGWTIGLAWALGGRWVEDHWVRLREHKVNMGESSPIEGP
jgi:undecaprenyl-diphosphatase